MVRMGSQDATRLDSQTRYELVVFKKAEEGSLPRVRATVNADIASRQWMYAAHVRGLNRASRKRRRTNSMRRMLRVASSGA